MRFDEREQHRAGLRLAENRHECIKQPPSNPTNSYEHPARFRCQALFTFIGIPHIIHFMWRAVLANRKSPWNVSGQWRHRAALIAGIVLWIACSPPLDSGTTAAASAGLDPASSEGTGLPVAECVMVDITTNTMQTLIGFMGSAEWPREKGNWMIINFRNPSGAAISSEHWTVINIHAENLWEIARRLDTKTVEVLILPGRIHETLEFEVAELKAGTKFMPPRGVMGRQAYALVTDVRIPRDWLRDEPSSIHRIPAPQAAEIKAAYPEYFRR